MFSWLSQRVSRRAAAVAGLGTALGIAAPAALLGLVPEMLWAALLAAPVAYVATGMLVDRTVGERVRTLSSFLLEQSDESSTNLKRLPDLGKDEVGQAAEAANQILSKVTDARVSVVDTTMELRAAKEQLRLQDELSAKKRELEARLSERGLLFSILEQSTRRPELGKMLRKVAATLGPELRLRELCIASAANGGKLLVRAAYGFPKGVRLVGRTLSRGEGVTGRVGDSRAPYIVNDVSKEPDYMAFWDQAPREGSFAAIPVYAGKQWLGMIALTRPADDPLSDDEVTFLRAVADTLALAIRQAKQVEELKSMSTKDELTGLGNRRLLKNRLSMELARARRFSNPLSALAIDVDHFKDLNDREGHGVGDRALKQLARVLDKGTRRVDTVARVGGEEFTVLLPKANANQALRVAEELRESVERHDFQGGDAQPMGTLTVSIGVAELASREDAAAFLERADQALYTAKTAGRNAVAVHHGGDRTKDVASENTHSNRSNSTEKASTRTTT